MALLIEDQERHVVDRHRLESDPNCSLCQAYQELDDMSKDQLTALVVLLRKELERAYLGSS